MHPRQMARAGQHNSRPSPDQYGSEIGSKIPTSSPAERMAAIFVGRQRDGFDDTTHLDLLGAGFTEAEILNHYDAALAIAGAGGRDIDVNAERTSYDRQARVMLGAVAIAGHFNPNAVNTTLRLAGLTTREIGNLFDDIIGEALRLVRPGRAALGGRH